MNRLMMDTSNETPVVGPVVQFALLIVPIVMNGFFMVYSLTGWILDGRDKFNWALEAETVALWVCAGMLFYCALVVAFTRLSGGHSRHPLMISSVAHALTVLVLTLSVFLSVRI